MTTPLLVVLAVLIAGTGYAAGRLHQWYRTDLDRDEAYREGYDTATRSTFSLAARLVGPRRDKSAVRASATVHAAAARESAAAATRQGTAAAARPTPPHAPSVLSPRPHAATPAAAAAQPDPAVPAARPDQPSSAARPDQPSSAARPDPAPAAFFAPSVKAVPPRAPAEPAPPCPAAAPPGPAVAEPEPAAARPDAEPSRPGRHLVPDELVQAPTYRLAPDRVARAKVSGPDAPPARPAVPKPRSS